MVLLCNFALCLNLLAREDGKKLQQPIPNLSPTAETGWEPIPHFMFSGLQCKGPAYI